MNVEQQWRKLQPERRRYVRPPSPHPDWWHTLHRLWTRAVGKPGYDKREWEKLENQMFKAAGKERTRG